MLISILVNFQTSPPCIWMLCIN